VTWTILGSMLLASAAELFTIFLSLQLTSLPLIVLVGFAKRDPRSGEAALKYLLLVLVSTAVLLYGMSLVYGSLAPEVKSALARKLEMDVRCSIEARRLHVWRTAGRVTEWRMLGVFRLGSRQVRAC